uniref:Uncharacterized protein n=1 Tax=Alexandrium andersonii TaxID=327968 RepID=A0A7S2ICB4_9DINO|mmetsp:Transcript_81362/g.181968  ORF Transcript_81362/g.181968 Transcript_81362/m.181968 type:complete len:111 (+) Transcript_81362:81-413(+)
MGDVQDVSLQLLELRKHVHNDIYSVTVDFEGKDEIIDIHPEKGPILRRADGLTDYVTHYLGRVRQTGGPGHNWGLNGRLLKGWRELTVTESEVLVHIAAKMNRRVSERLS